MRKTRITREMTTSTSDSNQLIRSSIENFTIGPVPTDSTGVVLSQTNDLGITDKLNALLQEYSAEIVRLPPTGSCASSITAKCPRGLIQSLYDMLNVNNNGCLQETQTFLQLLVSYLSSTQNDYINIPRNFWTQIGRVFNELNINESKINTWAAALRSMSMAFSTDVQSVASNNLLLSSLTNITDLQQAGIDPIDEDFQTEYPELIQEQPTVDEVLNEVISNVPTTIGEPSSTPPSNILDMRASTSSENVQLHDLDDPTNIKGQAYIGLKDLFSIKTLGVPISQLKIVEGGNVTYAKFTEIKIPIAGTFDSVTNDFNYGTVTALTQEVTPIQDVDVSKSLLNQDWSVVALSETRDANEKPKYINIMDLLNSKKRDNFDDKMQFRGAMSRSVYTYAQARGLASSLSGLWNKVVSMKLPSPAHIQTGTSILAAGLGAIGSLTGSSGLIKASNVVGAINDGLGSLLSNLAPTNGTAPSPAAAIHKNALTTIPCTIEAGKGVYESVMESAQQQRIKLSGMKNAIETGYNVAIPDSTRTVAFRRYNNVFR